MDEETCYFTGINKNLKGKRYYWNKNKEQWKRVYWFMFITKIKLKYKER